MSELKLSWSVTLTGDPPAVISCPDRFNKTVSCAGPQNVMFIETIIDQSVIKPEVRCELLASTSKSKVFSRVLASLPVGFVSVLEYQVNY
jgi:hypothetical protein